MQSSLKKTLVVFADAILLLSAIIVPNITSAKKQSNPGEVRNWQNDPSVIRVYNAETGALNYVSFPPNVRSRYNFTAFNSKAALSDLSTFAVEFGLGDISKTTKLVRTTTTVGGSTNYRYQQVISGVPVFAGDLVMNYDARGNLSAISGETLAKVTFPTTPRRDSGAAVQQAMEYVARMTNVPVSYL